MSELDRAGRTRQALIDAFVEIALEVGFDKFKVKAATMRLGVDRSTFYRYFSDKHDILTCTFRDGLDGIMDAVKQASSPHEEAALKYRYISQIPQVCRLYLSLPVDNPARQMVRQETSDWLFQRYRVKESCDVPLEVARDQMHASGDSLLGWYMDNLDSVSPEEVAELYDKLVLRGAADVALEPREDWLNSFD